jgi:hypothetical protein
MDMFNTKRRDVLSFDKYMDLNKEAFGGPKSAVAFKDKKGERANTSPVLKGYQRTVERDPMHTSKHYDSTYKAMTHDVVYRQEGRKATTYKDPYITAVPVIDVSGKTNEHMSCSSFDQFLNEQVTGKEIVMSIRGKSTKEAMGDAEEKMLQARIDWTNRRVDQKSGRIEYTDADGDLVSYIDGRTMYVMPEAPKMSDEQYDNVMAPSFDPDKPGKYLDRLKVNDEEPEMEDDEEMADEVIGGDSEEDEADDYSTDEADLAEIENRLRELEAPSESTELEDDGDDEDPQFEEPI